MTTDDYLAKIAPYARVMIHQHDDDTWSATATLRIRAEGGEFKIKSEFNHKCAPDALRVLLSRILNVVRQASDLKRLSGGE